MPELYYLAVSFYYRNARYGVVIGYNRFDRSIAQIEKIREIARVARFRDASAGRRRVIAPGVKILFDGTKVVDAQRVVNRLKDPGSDLVERILGIKSR